MRGLFIVETLLCLCMFFISQIFVLTLVQHIIGVSIVGVVFCIYRIVERSKKKIVAYYFKKSKKMGIFFYITRYTKVIGYIPSNTKEMSINVQIGIELCRLVLQSVVVAIFLSQIVFIPMNIIENSISLTVGIIFYVLCCESLFILPILMFKEFKMKRIDVAIK